MPSRYGIGLYGRGLYGFSYPRVDLAGTSDVVFDATGEFSGVGPVFFTGIATVRFINVANFGKTVTFLEGHADVTFGPNVGNPYLGIYWSVPFEPPNAWTNEGDEERTWDPAYNPPSAWTTDIKTDDIRHGILKGWKTHC